MVSGLGPVAQLDRALPSEGRGREFESRRVRHNFIPPEAERAARSGAAEWPNGDLARLHRQEIDVKAAAMHQPNGPDAPRERPQARKLDRIRDKLRHSVRRNRSAVEGLACVLGLLIGIVLGTLVSREAPTGRSLDDGRPRATTSLF